MSNHNNFLENLINLSGENTEELLQTYFDSVNGTASDEQILQTLENVSKRLNEMQGQIQHQLKAVKKHL